MQEEEPRQMNHESGFRMLLSNGVKTKHIPRFKAEQILTHGEAAALRQVALIVKGDFVFL